jgi:pimeloyl-ACP methyl ester carboxylesterase
MRLCVLLPGLLVLLGCSKSPTAIVPERPAAQGDIPLVFIPGLSGSVLTDSSGQTQWLTAGQALHLQTSKLALPLRWDGDHQGEDGLRAVGILGTVRAVPYLFERRVYSPWVDFAANIKRRPLLVFAYDWRRDNGETVQHFEQFLESVKARYAGQRPMVVAHSMGGLITLALQNRRPDLIDRVVYVGVPFRGGIGYLDNMYLGTPTGLNGALLSPAVLFSLPSVYSFYPGGLPFESPMVAEDEAGQPLALNFFAAATWKENGFGPYAPQNRGWAQQSASEDAFLAKVLERALAFRQQLQPPPGQTYRPALVVSSQRHPTLARMRRIAPAAGEAVPRWDFDGVAKQPGDDSVPYRDAMPPQPIPHAVVESDYTHSYLLNDPKVQTQIERFVRE